MASHSAPVLVGSPPGTLVHPRRGRTALGYAASLVPMNRRDSVPLGHSRLRARPLLAPHVRSGESDHSVAKSNAILDEGEDGKPDARGIVVFLNSEL